MFLQFGEIIYEGAFSFCGLSSRIQDMDAECRLKANSRPHFLNLWQAELALWDKRKVESCASRNDLFASTTSEVKNDYAHFITQGICNKFIEVNFYVGCMV